MTKEVPGAWVEPRIVEGPGIELDDIDPDALGAVRRLSDAGAPAFFVGGCVRDLLLGRRPKDFDVVTPISLRRVRRIFRANSRVIGRRHRLVHVFFPGGKVIEVSTFPRPEEDETSDEEAEILDAFRRDFTVNALYYDPIDDVLIDYVDGFEDIQDRVIRSIGPPRENFNEDSVRIIRGIRYACLLDFEIEAETWSVMKEMAWIVSRANKRRMQEELWKFLLIPRTEACFRIFADLGILSILFPEIREFLDPEGPSHFWKYLAAKDRLDPNELSHTLATSTLFLPLLDEIEDLGEGDLATEEAHLVARCADVVESIGRTYSLARKIRYGIGHLLEAQLRLIRGPDGRRRRLAQSLHFEQAMRLFRIFTEVRGKWGEWIGPWEVERQKRLDGGTVEVERERPRRRRRRRRKPSGDE